MTFQPAGIDAPSGEFAADVIIRGEIISGKLIEFGGRGQADFRFRSPDPESFMDRLPLANPAGLADLYELSFDDIVDYLEELGRRLDLDRNDHLQKALLGSFQTAPTTPPIVEYTYRMLGGVFVADNIRDAVEQTVGVDYIEGWVPTTLADGRLARVRAFGARTLHIVAGNAPLISALTILRNAVSRSDAIIKSPSNDPFTALAIVRTMCDMAPEHALTKHVSVAYWRGGDEAIEKRLYQPHYIEKIIAWGGLASVKHVTRYIQPGLELISLDPKRSISVIGDEVFDTEENMRDAAHRLAIDFGTLNQCGCVNSRIAYVQSGKDEAGLARLRVFGGYVYEALLALPSYMSTKAKDPSQELASNVEAIRLLDDWYDVIGADDGEGAVIVSLLSEPVSFADHLADRTINLVPIDETNEIYGFCDAYTQTVGIWPEALKLELRDKLPLFGAQRIVSLGYATTNSYGLPQDAIEPFRRAVKWIVDEVSEPSQMPPGWPAPA